MDELSDIETKQDQIKSLAQRTREEFTFSDGGEDGDDEVLLAYREEMIQFMVDVHRRKKRVIEEYEKKEAVSKILLLLFYSTFLFFY
jgi:DNA helicase INO80